MKNNFKIAICQMKVVDDKDINLKHAANFIERSAAGGADLVVLPEMFNCPYDTQKFSLYSENREDSKSLKKVREAARECGVHLVAGSLPESDNGNIYNSSFIFNSDGDMLGVHRKLHLFDIDVPGEIYFKESETLTPGDEITIVESDLCKIGVAICYDIRFAELLRIMTLEGAELLVTPGAFNMTTGPAHWETLIRSRAMDNQVYVAAASPARDENASYVAYGHSMIVDPWGEVLAQAGAGEEIIYARIKSSRIKEIRNQLPLLKNRRDDLYDLKKI